MIESAAGISRRSLLKAGAALALGGSTPLSAAMRQETGPLSVFRGATASILTDALGRAGYDPRRYVMSPEIRPVTRKGEMMVGPAVTTKWVKTNTGFPPEAVQKYVFQPIDEAPAGSVWVVASGIERLYSMFGDLIAIACERRGMSGAVTDGGCRDIATMEDVEFPVFAKGVVLHGPGDLIAPVAANVEVICGGVPVRPGDIIAGDADGVLVIPQEAVDDVARIKEELVEEEVEVRRMIEEGVPLATAYSYR